jgi:hypothetical protein
LVIVLIIDNNMVKSNPPIVVDPLNNKVTLLPERGYDDVTHAVDLSIVHGGREQSGAYYERNQK